MVKLVVAFFLCLGLAIYLAVVLGRILYMARRNKSISSKGGER